HLARRACGGAIESFAVSVRLRLPHFVLLFAAAHRPPQRGKGRGAAPGRRGQNQRGRTPCAHTPTHCCHRHAIVSEWIQLPIISFPPPAAARPSTAPVLS